MSDEKKTVELLDEDLEKVIGGVASVEGWSNYQGKCVCGQTFTVSDKGIKSREFECTCGRKYELVSGDVYCDSVLLPSTSYTVTD